LLRDHGTEFVRDRNNLVAFTIKAARSVPRSGWGENGGWKWLNAATQVRWNGTYASEEARSQAGFRHHVAT
jgi:hypothetical protein